MTSRNWLFLTIIFVTALLPRALDLDAFISPDEPRWLENTLGFRRGLATGDFSELYQQPHPGIVNMWLTAATVTSDSWGTRRLPLVVAVSLLVVFATYLMARRWGWSVGVIAGLLLAVNPHFIAHSRVLAMDALLSIFLLLSVLAALVWLGERKWYWLMLSGVTAALAVLSKMIGIVLVPVIFAVLLMDWLRLHFKKLPLPIGNASALQYSLKAGSIWIAAMVLAAVVMLPTIITDFDKVASGTKEFFTTEHYSHQIHALGPLWYFQAFLLWTTPLQLIGLIGFLAFVGVLNGKNEYWRPEEKREDMGVLLLFIGLLGFAIQYSIKKGDRYALPEFLFFDVLVALTLVGAWRLFPQKWVRGIIAGLFVVALGWQMGNLFELHPHYLAYRNPFFRNVAEGRTMGWGEGLDLAAYYLNEKPNAKNMLVISYYENSFAQHFVGQVTSAERLAKETPEEVGGQYVVLYRTMQGRAPDRWETQVLADFSDKAPEKVISLNGEEYVWIHSVN